jgi:hypothetical protein
MAWLSSIILPFEIRLDKRKLQPYKKVIKALGTVKYND